MTQLWRAFGHLVPLMFMVGLPVVTVVGAARTRHLRAASVTDRSPVVRATVEMLLLFSVLVVAALTLTPSPGSDARSLDTRPFVDIVTALAHGRLADHSIVQFLANAVLLAPSGALATALLGQRMTIRRQAALGLVSGAGIEFLQLVLPLGRAVSAEDLLANAVGFFVGALGVRWMASNAVCGRAAARRPTTTAD